MQSHILEADLLFPSATEKSSAGQRSQKQISAAQHRAQYLNAETMKDLGLDEIARKMGRDGIRNQQILEIISALPIDLDVIRYRQDIFEDIYRSPVLFSAFEKLIPKIDEILLFSDTRKDSRNPLQEAVWRLGELELYVECLDDLLRAFCEAGQAVRSEGLTRLKRFLDTTTSTDQFNNLRQELPKLREGLRKKRSVTIGINLDERLRPVEATLLSINEEAFREKTLLLRLFGTPTDDDFETTTPIHSSPIPREYAHDPQLKVPLSPLFQDIEQLLGSTIRPMVRVLNRFVAVNTSNLRVLQRDAAFYLGAVSLFHDIERLGLPVSKPLLKPIDQRYLDLTGFHNLLLAMRETESPDHIVLNNASFDEESRLQILTGPNQGGKTTFTQGIGVLHVLAQCGMFVPAQSAVLSPADRIVTHFPAEERGQIATGRLGEEAVRFAAMFEEVTRYSLVLLNESLTSTSPAEGEFLAEDIVRALSALGARGIFATHLHDLARRVDKLNNEVAGKSRIGSLVAGILERDDSEVATRTFQIRKGEPMGKSFARDIAEKYGISYEQIARRLKERNVL